MASTRFPCAQTLSKTSNSLLRSYLLALMASNSLPTSRLGYRFTRNCSSSTAPVRTLDYEFTNGSSEVELNNTLGDKKLVVQKMFWWMQITPR
ncbi:hypothetical protein SDJN03_09898, partial [Cucurbita argyrosperma subsp. sororia]